MVQAVLHSPIARRPQPAPAPLLLDVEPELEGLDLMECVIQHLDFVQVGSPATSVCAPANAEALGYRPRRWPVEEAFREDATFRQRALMHQEGWRRGLTKSQLQDLKAKIAQEYGLFRDDSKGAAILVLDWLRHAPR